MVLEDGDQYGVTFAVYDLSLPEPRCAYRAYVQHPEDDPEPATAARAFTGPGPAAAAAALYEVAEGPLLAVEADASPVWENLGVIGDPFDPWLDAMGLTWPDP